MPKGGGEGTGLIMGLAAGDRIDPWPATMWLNDHKTVFFFD
jgi:hypothetical protein